MRSESRFLPTPHAFDDPLGGFPSEYRPFGMEKLEWLGYPMVKKLQRYFYSFRCNSRTWQTDGRTLHAGNSCAYA